MKILLIIIFLITHLIADEKKYNKEPFSDEIKIGNSSMTISKTNVSFLGVEDNKIYYFDKLKYKLKFEYCSEVLWVKDYRGNKINFDCNINTFDKSLYDEDFSMQEFLDDSSSIKILQFWVYPIAFMIIVFGEIF